MIIELGKFSLKVKYFLCIKKTIFGTLTTYNFGFYLGGFYWVPIHAQGGAAFPQYVVKFSLEK